MKSVVWSTLAFFVLWAPASALGDGTLNFYNWGDYTNPELLKKFTLETGIQVMNLEAGGVDFAIDEFNADLVSEDMLAQVNAAKDAIISGDLVVHDYTTDSSCPAF